MNARQKHLLDRIKIIPRTKRFLDDSGVVCRLNQVSKAIRDEIGWLFEEYPYLGIFEEETNPPYSKSRRNSWQLSSSLLDRNLGDAYMGAEKCEDQGDYMWNYLEIGSSLFDGGIGICEDSAMFGKIAYITFDANSERGDVPVVASSFTEWLERTLDHGPDADCFYWQKPDFVDLGPAIPNDPSYRPVGRTPGGS